jgi:AAA+ ATPase superfamily predicted ATPase
MLKIEENFLGFVAKVYEDLAVEYTLRNYPLLKAGRWWNKDEEIDIVGVGEKFILVGECKYSNKKVGVNILKQLEVKSKKIELNLPIKQYLLFSKSGFTKDLIDMAKNREDIILIDSFSTP